MNPWEVLRREIDGAIRSLRYDLMNRRVRHLMNEDTAELPVIAPTPEGDRRRRVILATSGALVVAGAVSGYYAVTNGLDALVARGDSPAGLPETPRRVSPSPAPTQVTVIPSIEGQAKVPVAHTSQLNPRPTQSTSVSPTMSPPVPTPAPTCNCPTPTPTSSISPTPTPSASSTQPTTAPTSAATR